MDDDHARELLARERARIEAALAETQAPAGEGEDPDGADPSDAGAELLEAEIGEGIAERLKDELAAIERAETRLAEGRYGLSVESGEPIPDGRLELIPWAERSAEEQSRYEQGGG